MTSALPPHRSADAPAPAGPARPGSRAVALALAADTAAVVVFVLVGRRSHEEASALAGVARTAWPFLAGLAAGWGAARAWRVPAGLRTGVVVWLGTALVGQGLRLASGQGSAVSFLVVTLVALGVLQLGWRAAAALVGRRR